MPATLWCPRKRKSFRVKSASADDVRGREIKCPVCRTVHEAAFPPDQPATQPAPATTPVSGGTIVFGYVASCAMLAMGVFMLAVIGSQHVSDLAKMERIWRDGVPARVVRVEETRHTGPVSYSNLVVHYEYQTQVDPIGLGTSTFSARLDIDRAAPNTRPELRYLENEPDAMVLNWDLQEERERSLWGYWLGCGGLVVFGLLLLWGIRILQRDRKKSA